MLLLVWRGRLSTTEPKIRPYVAQAEPGQREHNLPYLRQKQTRTDVQIEDSVYLRGSE